MPLELLPKYIGQSWIKWFYEILLHNNFEKINANKYVKGGVEVRIFRATKRYEVYKEGVKLADNLDFAFPHLTKLLHA